MAEGTSTSLIDATTHDALEQARHSPPFPISLALLHFAVYRPANSILQANLLKVRKLLAPSAWWWTAHPPTLNSVAEVEGDAVADTHCRAFAASSYLFHSLFHEFNIVQLTASALGQRWEPRFVCLTPMSLHVYKGAGIPPTGSKPKTVIPLMGGARVEPVQEGEVRTRER